MPQWNFLAVFDPEAKSSKANAFVLAEQRRQIGGQGCSSVKDDLQWARVCPATVFWGNLAYFALPSW